jgi:hypothetical protein
MYLLFDKMQWSVFDLIVVIDFRIRGEPASIEGLICFFLAEAQRTQG